MSWKTFTLTLQLVMTPKLFIDINSNLSVQPKRLSELDRHESEPGIQLSPERSEADSPASGALPSRTLPPV